MMGASRVVLGGALGVLLGLSACQEAPTDVDPLACDPGVDQERCLDAARQSCDPDTYLWLTLEECGEAATCAVNGDVSLCEGAAPETEPETEADPVDDEPEIAIPTTCETLDDCDTGCCSFGGVCDGDTDADGVCDTDDVCPDANDTHFTDDTCQECVPQFTGSACEECIEPCPVCVDDDACADGETCVGGVCMEPPPECDEDAECDEGDICMEGECVEEPECIAHVQCGDNEACVQNECVAAGPSPVPTVCQFSADCDCAFDACSVIDYSEEPVDPKLTVCGMPGMDMGEMMNSGMMGDGQGPPPKACIDAMLADYSVKGCSSDCTPGGVAPIFGMDAVCVKAPCADFLESLLLCQDPDNPAPPGGLGNGGIAGAISVLNLHVDCGPCGPEDLSVDGGAGGVPD